jgi:hypothetical protein
MNAGMLGSLLVLALGVAITPPGIIALLTFLATERRKGVMFALGLTTAVVFGCVLGLFLASPSSSSASPAGPSWRDVIVLVLGVITIGAGIYIWRQPADKIGGPLGKALAAVEKTPMWLAYALGTIMVNFIPAIIAVNDIQAAKLPQATALAYFVFFFLVATSTWSIPILFSFVAVERWSRFSEKATPWMLAHGNTVLGIVIALIGVFIAWGGLQPMLG